MRSISNVAPGTLIYWSNLVVKYFSYAFYIAPRARHYLSDWWDSQVLSNWLVVLDIAINSTRDRVSRHTTSCILFTNKSFVSCLTYQFNYLLMLTFKNTPR